MERGARPVLLNLHSYSHDEKIILSYETFLSISVSITIEVFKEVFAAKRMWIYFLDH